MAEARLVVFGHLAEGNLHVNVLGLDDTARDVVERTARETVAEWLQGSEPKKVIYVEKKLVNFVI